MGKLVIRPCTVADIESAQSAVELLEEYAAESSIEGMPRPSAQMNIYRSLESAGIFYLIGAFQGPELIGLIIVLTTILPHYGVCTATVESFFVAKKHRKSGVGHKLRQAAEQYAKEKGAAGILASAPYGGILAKVLPGVGYQLTNQVFFKRLAGV